ncbi:hypothetical protein ACIBEK_29330 [Nocardia fusca]|uniref:hypothetical protein n=1 Tax=Nocardia fusca TaxID=941183 RepID=UPI00379366FB
MADNPSAPAAESRGCTELLADGSKALRYFEILEARYLRWVGAATPPDFKRYVDLHKLFYHQNGLNEGAFRRAADTLKTVLDRVATERNQQAVLAQTLPTVWSGEAATRAATMIATQLQLSEADINIVRKVHEEMDATPQALRQAVAIKAKAAEGILLDGDPKVLGKSPEDIDTIITFAHGFGWSSSLGGDTLIDKINRIFPDLAPGSGSTLIVMPGGDESETTYVGKMKARCISWLNETFKPDYESNLKEFVDACNQTNQQVSGIYDELVKAFTGLNVTKYPCPKVSTTSPSQPTSPAGTNQPSSTGTPSTGTPSTTDTPSTTNIPSTTNTPSTTGTPSTNPATTDNPLSTIAQLGTQLASSGLATQLSEGLSSLVSSASQQIGSTLEQLREQAEQVLDPDGEDDPGKDLDGDGKPDQDADGDGKPDKDLDGDGKPDADVDGDGKPDADLDGDGKPDADTDGDGKPDADKGVEFNGKNYKLEVGSDGRLTLVVDDAAGEPVTYKVEVGPDGTPVIVGENQPGATAPPATQEQQPAGQPAGVPGTPAGTKQEDGEHRPQSYPVQQPEENAAEPEEPVPPPAPAVDTGAQLAEAGPL